MPLWPGPDEATAHWTFDALDGGGTLLREGGRLGLDLTPRNLVAPAYGLGLAPSGRAGRLRLDGVNQYGDLAAGAAGPAVRWYANAPTTALTVGIVARWAAPAANDVIFSCLNGGPTRGLAVRLATAERVQIAAYDAAGAIMTCQMSVDAPLTGRTRVVVLTMQQAASAVKGFVDGAPVAVAFAGSLNPIAYDAAVLPTVGSVPGGGSYHEGDFMAIHIWPKVLLNAEIGSYTDYWRSNKV